MRATESWLMESGDSHNIVRVNKFRRLRGAWYVARIEEGTCFKNLVDKPIGKRPLRDYLFLLPIFQLSSQSQVVFCSL